MITEIIEIDENKIDKNAIKKAGEIIKNGDLVAFPTETVYGLGGDGLNKEAVEKIFRAKGRPSDNPLILHIWCESQLDTLVRDIKPEAKICMDEFWPGPLTLIFNKSSTVPDIITAGLETVAIRMPDNKIARDLIREANTPIAAPSANTSGRPSPTKADHVAVDLNGKIPLIIDGGEAGVGLESTVLDLTEEVPIILRPGGITLEDLEKVLGLVEVDKSILEDKPGLIPKSPGQKYKHYAPRAEMTIYEGSEDRVREKIEKEVRILKEKGKKVGIMCFDESRSAYGHEFTISLGSRKDKTLIAHNLFKVLRDFDEEDIDIILAESVDRRGLGVAIMNRMTKAAGGRIIQV